jgi:hypothetical protein
MQMLQEDRHWRKKKESAELYVPLLELDHSFEVKELLQFF